jgi:hypothetical protein
MLGLKIWLAVLVSLGGTQLFLGLRRKAFRMRGGGYIYRQEQPLFYWTLVVVHLPVMFVMLALIILLPND